MHKLYRFFATSFLPCKSIFTIKNGLLLGGLFVLLQAFSPLYPVGNTLPMKRLAVSEQLYVNSTDGKAQIGMNAYETIKGNLIPLPKLEQYLILPGFLVEVQEDVAKVISMESFGAGGDPLTYGIKTNPANGTLGSFSNTGPTTGIVTITYTPNQDFFGSDQFEIVLTDPDGSKFFAMVDILVVSENDPPTITCGPNQTVLNTAGAQSVLTWATGISVGPPNESGQAPGTITVANDNNSLFSVQPSVAPNGTLSYTPMAGAFGFANVTVTMSDGIVEDDVSCSFTITVQAVPDAIDDDFTTRSDTDLNGILFKDNGNGIDDLGFPAATITHFGGGSLGGTVIDNLAGATVALAGGSLQVNANGTFSLTGQPFTQGTFTFNYRLANAVGLDDATVTILITPPVDPVVCNADAYTATGNIAISIAAPGVLTNDGGTLPTISAVEGSGTNIGVATAATNGTVTLNADGSFTFQPAAGFTGAASFDYTVDNILNQPSTCTVTITVSQMVWFIDNNGGGSGGSGTFSDPFKTIADFNGAAGPGTGDFISLATGTYVEADGINLKDNQTLIGEEVALSTHFTADANSIASYGTFAGTAGTAPDINPTAGNGVDVADGNTLRGFDIDPPAANHGILGSLADGTIGLTVSNVAIGGTGIDGIEIPNASGIFSISAVSVTGGESIGIDISTINASVADVTITGCTIDASAVATGRGIDLEASNTSTMTFDVINNPTLEMMGGTGVVIIARDNASMDGFVRNNPNIDLNGAAGQGVLVDARNNAAIVAEVSGNTINLGTDTGGGIRVAADNPGSVGIGAATMNAIILNNNITIGQNVNFGRGIQLVDHNAHTLCAAVAGNVITDASTNTDIGISIIDQGAATVIQLQGLAGGPFTSAGALGVVDAWWTAQGNTDNADAGSTFLQGTVTVGTCSTPTP